MEFIKFAFYLIILHSSQVKGRVCPAKCHKELNVHWWLIPPYIYEDANGNVTGLFPKLLKDMVEACCGTNCSRIVYNARNQSETDLLNEATGNSSSIYFPIYGTMLQTMKMGKFYIPLLESPGIVHLTNDGKTMGSASDVILVAISRAWPLMCLMVLGSVVSGVIVWALDCYWNPHQFPINFFKGCWDGFWWAWVSMTTVGYGDRTPKSITARIFAFVWVLFGVVIIAVFNGVITAQLTSFTLTSNPSLYGQQVLVMSGTEEGRYALSMNANISEVNDVVSLRQTLMENEHIKGALLDIYLAGHHKDLLSPKFQFRVLQILEHHYAYGMLLTGEIQTSKMKMCFLQYVSMNQHLINKDIQHLTEKVELSKNTLSKEKSENMLHPKSKWFIQLVIGSTCFIVFFGLIGIAWQYRNKICGKEFAKEEVVDTPPEKNMEDLLQRQCLELEQAMEDEVHKFYKSWNEKKMSIYQKSFSDGLYITDIDSPKHTYIP